MASYQLPNGGGGIHKTLTGTTADTVTVAVFDDVSVNIEVKNRSTSTNPIFVRVDGTTAVASADGTTVIEPGEFFVFDVRQGSNGVATLSVVGNGDTYDVDRLP